MHLLQVFLLSLDIQFYKNYSHSGKRENPQPGLYFSVNRVTDKKMTT